MSYSSLLKKQNQKSQWKHYNYESKFSSLSKLHVGTSAKERALV